MRPRLSSTPWMRSALGAALFTLAALPAAVAQTPDFMVSKIELNQAIQTGVTTLVGERPTMARATVRMVGGPLTPVFVDGVLRVYDDGVEIAGSPFFSDNGPIHVVQPVDPANLEHTLNFSFIPPVSAAVSVAVQVNPPGPNHVAELSGANNVNTKGPLDFVARGVPELVFSPIDYRPSGGPTPNLPDPDLIEPGVGDNFVQGIYPVPDLDYHRTDAPSKLWTSSLAGSGSSLNNSLTTDLQLTVPQPDYIYGWVPGSLSYNGQSIIGGVASMGNTQPIRHQRTYAHELGHNTGLTHVNSSTGTYGIDVEHHLAITQALPVLKLPSLKDVMVGGQLTDAAWVYAAHYNHWLGHASFQADTDAATAAPDDGAGPVLFVAGVWNTTSGAVTLTDVLEIPSGQPSAPASGGSDVLLRAFAGGRLVRHLPVARLGSEDCSDADSAVAVSEVAFQANLPLTGPEGAPVDRVEVHAGGDRPLQTLVLSRSAHAPQVSFVSPTAALLDGQLVDGRLRVEWQGVDADGDALTYYLRYSRDGEQFSPLLTSTTATSHEVDLARLPRLVDGKGFFELLASDGLRTVGVRTPPLSAPSLAQADGGGNAPWAHLLTPDDGTAVLQGRNLILHAMAWDLEDDALVGADVVWTSDVDGLLGTGRRTSVATLTPGAHNLTVTVTDGDGMQSADSADVVVVARGLPDVGGTTCQTDLGFGGPGSVALSVCGGDLSSGTTATLSLTGAPPSTTAWLVLCTGTGPTPFAGGLLVPSPITLASPMATDGAGTLTITGIPGGNGPLSLVLQFVVVDGGQVGGYALSNALQLDFLP